MRLSAQVVWNLILIITITTSAGSATAADCSCGYTINATNPILFTNTLETDFLHYNQTWDPVTGLPKYAGATAKNWIPQAYTVRPDDESNPWGKKAEYGNVVTNSIQSEWNWGGDGVGQNRGLELWVRKVDEQRLVPMAEIVSGGDDMLYGSFRIGMKMTDVEGTVGAFFFYFNDSTEIDIEILSRQNLNKTINLVIQSPQSAAQGYASGPEFSQHTLSFSPASGYNEYRFDWLPNRVDFYANSILLTSITENVPSSPGKLHISHWSNGNAGWSAGPPGQDAVMVVSYVKGYFNTSSEKSVLACVGAKDKVCGIPDQTVPPEVSGANGNKTGKTWFFESMSEISATNASEEAPKTGDAMSQDHGTWTSVRAYLVLLIMAGCIS